MKDEFLNVRIACNLIYQFEQVIKEKIVSKSNAIRPALDSYIFMERLNSKLRVLIKFKPNCTLKQFNLNTFAVAAAISFLRYEEVQPIKYPSSAPGVN